MTDHYVNSDGVYIGGYGEGAAPEDSELINLGDNPPEYADQVWQFPGWGSSPLKLAAIENEWRISETAIAKDNLDAILFEDPEALPGTEAQWKAYGVALRKWKTGNPDFPDETKRPTRPEADE